MPPTAASWSTRPAGEEGPPVVLLTGPPLGGALFREVQRRMAPRRTVALELIDPALDSLGALSGALAQALVALGAREVVAHGAAVPVALGLPAGAVDALVLTQGPLERLDPILGALSRLGEGALCQVFRPALLHRWLASSAGLRRTVVNPYAMERDTVVMLTEAWCARPEARLAAARWLRALRGPLPAAPPGGARILAVWGDADALYPVESLKSLMQGPGFEGLVRVPGGRHHHVEEMPWALADAVSAWLGAPRAGGHRDKNVAISAGRA